MKNILLNIKKFFYHIYHNKTTATASFFIFFFITAFILRYNHDNFPPSDGFGFEEFQTAENALNLWQDNHIVLEHFITNFLPALSFFFFKIANPFTLRLPFIILGSLTIPFFYLLLTMISPPFTAFFVTSLFLVSRWHIFGSRIADELFTGIFLETLLLLFLIKSIRLQKLPYFLLLGLFTGLISYEYIGYRSSLIFVGFSLFYYVLTNIQKQRVFFRSLFFSGAGILIFIVVSFPIYQSMIHGDDFLWEGFRRHANDRLGGGSQILGIMVKKNLPQILPNLEIVYNRSISLWEVLFTKGSSILELGASLPFFDPVAKILILCGYIYTFLTLGKPWRLLIFLWFTISILIAVVFPINFYPARLTPFLPFFFLFIAFLLNDLETRILSQNSSKKSLKKIFIFTLAISLIILSTTYNFIYFKIQPVEVAQSREFYRPSSSDLCAKNIIHGWICNYK